MHIYRLPSGVHMQVEADRAAAFINRETGGVQLCGSQRKNTNKIQHNIYNSAGSPPPRTDAQQHVVQLLHSYSAHTCAVTKEQTHYSGSGERRRMGLWFHCRPRN